MICQRDTSGSYVEIDEFYCVYDAMERGINFIGNYFVWNMYKGQPDKCSLITEEWINTDKRFFELYFIIHHNLRVGINKTNS